MTSKKGATMLTSAAASSFTEENVLESIYTIVMSRKRNKLKGSVRIRGLKNNGQSFRCISKEKKGTC